jgi:protein SCO1/2
MSAVERCLLRPRAWAFIGLAVALLLASSPLAWAEKGHPASAGHQHPTDLPEDVFIGIDEKLGSFVPLDIAFRDEEARTVKLEELVTKPTIVALVYYTCTDVCPLLLNGVAEVLGRLPSIPGRDYMVLSVSFDEKDTPAQARAKKANFIHAVGKPFPGEAWRFLTGDKRAIERFTEAVGFRFKRRGDAFLHPVSLVVLSPRGKVVRYLYGNNFLPLDVKLALTEASEGRYGPTISRLLLYCFSYDPQGRRYVFNTLRVAGAAVLFAVGMVFALLVIKRPRREPEGE